MPSGPVTPLIRLRGVRQNNLKDFDLDLPLRRLIVITGPSGSGKSSLAFDTLFAEGQRRYIETFSPYARQFFDRMDKPQVDHVDGIPPAIAIEQRNTVRTTRSTVGTVTEIGDYLKLLWPHVAELHCRSCDRLVRIDTPSRIWESLPPSGEAWITFDLLLSAKLTLRESLALVGRQGYRRLWLDGQAVRLDAAEAHLAGAQPTILTVVQDRIRLAPSQRARFAEACEQAYHFGKGRLTVRLQTGDHWQEMRFSNRLHCAECDREYRDPSPALFSFNHPLGACPTCRGFGRVIGIDYQRALPDPSRTVAQGVVRPWQSGQGLECQRDLLRFCRAQGIRTDVPFSRLPADHQRWIVEGDPEYGSDDEHEWPRAWYGVKGYFRWLESKAYKMHVRVLLSRYRAYTTCPDCHGRRFQPEALDFRIACDLGLSAADHPQRPVPSSLTLADFYQLPIRDALRIADTLATRNAPALRPQLGFLIAEIRNRLNYLVDVGVGYLTLDRPTRTLSGGETERVQLTTCLGTQLVNTLYVLDEPSVGLHPRDIRRLVQVLGRLRDLGNTVVVVEHEPGVILAADHIVDLGPGHGESGGNVVFAGSYARLLKSRSSLTGQYLSGQRKLDPPPRRQVCLATLPRLRLENATLHNLKNFTVEIPLARLVCVTGVSGSGKTTLIREILYPLLAAELEKRTRTIPPPRGCDAGEDREPADRQDLLQGARLHGAQHLSQVVLVDQSPIGRTPRSNPAVYVGAFDPIRELFAQSDSARQRGLNASAFSFNSPQGQCARCRGAGFERIEMQFLSDVFIRCPECGGQRYRPHVLEARIAPPAATAPLHQPTRARRDARRFMDAERASSSFRHASRGSAPLWNIADVLAATVDDAVDWLERFGEKRPAFRARSALGVLQRVGLGYLCLGQAINTLSGGESQRLKLAGKLAEFELERQPATRPRPCLFLLDEPTTGLHLDDIRILLGALQSLVAAGHGVVVIEHNLDFIRAADWVIDLGPEAGEEGGRIVAEGSPEAIRGCLESHTGRALADVDKVGILCE